MFKKSLPRSDLEYNSLQFYGKKASIVLPGNIRKFLRTVIYLKTCEKLILTFMCRKDRSCWYAVKVMFNPFQPSVSFNIETADKNIYCVCTLITAEPPPYEPVRF